MIPQRSDPRRRQRGRRPDFDKETCRRRGIIECCVGWLKECRRLAARFEKLAVNFLAVMKAAMIERCLRIVFSDGA